MKTKFIEPTTFAEAATLLTEYGEDAKLIAGGTAVVLMMGQKLINPSALISLGRIPDADFIRQEDDGLHIGALSLLGQIARSPQAAGFHPALAHAFGVVGNVRIRNQATLGGNLAEADYASDPPAMLLALDAQVSTVSPSGERQIPLKEFFLGFYTTALAEDEILTEVHIPQLPESANTAYLKFTSRSAEDRPCVGVAAVADLSPNGVCIDLRVAVGAAVETPQRLPDVEAQAVGEELNDTLIAHIAEEYAQTLDPLEDARGSAWYRREMIGVFVRRALTEVRDASR